LLPSGSTLLNTPPDNLSLLAITDKTPPAHFLLHFNFVEIFNLVPNLNRCKAYGSYVRQHKLSLSLLRLPLSLSLSDAMQHTHICLHTSASSFLRHTYYFVCGHVVWTRSQPPNPMHTLRSMRSMHTVASSQRRYLVHTLHACMHTLVFMELDGHGGCGGKPKQYAHGRQAEAIRSPSNAHPHST
jgi:hypothetical protein